MNLLTSKESDTTRSNAAICCSTQLRRWQLILVHFFSTLLFILALVGCQRSAGSPALASVEGLCAFAHSPDLSLGVTDEIGLVNWVTGKHGVVPEQSVQTDGDSREAKFYWVQDYKYHWFARVWNGRLTLVSQLEVENGPTFGHVVAAWGAPGSVYGYVGLICEDSCPYDLGVDYPILGVSIQHSSSEPAKRVWKTGKAALELKQDMSVTSIHCYKPTDSMDSALRDGFGNSEQTVKIQMSMRSPWPGFGSLVPLGPR